MSNFLEDQIRVLVRSDMYAREDIHEEVDQAVNDRAAELKSEKEDQSLAIEAVLTCNVKIWFHKGQFLVKVPWAKWPIQMMAGDLAKYLGFTDQQILALIDQQVREKKQP